MNLNEEQYDKIKSGKKKIEIRLFDKKRQEIKIGDTISFSRSTELNKNLRVKVVGLLRYPSFQKLIQDFPMSIFGYPKKYDQEKFIKEIHRFYTPKEEKELGVLGIRIELLE